MNYLKIMGIIKHQNSDDPVLKRNGNVLSSNWNGVWGNLVSAYWIVCGIKYLSNENCPSNNSTQDFQIYQNSLCEEISVIEKISV